MRTGSGTNSGNWEELIVSNYSGSTLTLTSAHTRVYVFGAGCRVQVIRIPRYWDLDLVSGQITCHPWDDTTGGVLALHVGNKFFVQWGLINASRKGFNPLDIQWGQGGAGGPGDNVFNNDAGGQSAANLNVPPCITPTPSQEFFGTLGDDGDGVPSGSLGANGTSTSGSRLYYPKGSWLSYQTTLGNAGYYPSGTGGGTGGDGGGHGGGGGIAANSNSGSSGTAGDPAENGGAAGEGAIGGGIILIKVNRLVYSDLMLSGSNLWPFIWIAGQNGAAGKNGGAGGSGGVGGEGGLGNQTGTAVYYSGGNGGNGEDGMGADGGDGANGAQAGFCGLYIGAGVFYRSMGYDYIETNPGPYIYSATVQHPGRGGAGGKGGYTLSRASLSETKRFDLDSPYSYCPPQPAGCIQEVCNCDSVMRAFQHMNNLISTNYYYPAPGLDSFSLNLGSVGINSKNYVTYRRSTGQFKYRMYHDPLLLDCYTDHYCYVFDSLDCFRAVDAFSYLRHNVHFSHTKLKAELVGSDVHFQDDSFRLNFIWSSSDQILYDVLTPTQPRCYAATCNPNSPGNPDHPSRGGEGSTGFGSQEVPLYQNDTGNLYFFTGVSGPMPEINKNEDIRLAWQNDGEVLQLTAKGEVDIWQAAVYDLSGRLRLQRTALNRSDAGLDMKSLSPGVYLLHIQSSDGDRYVKICKP